jgi:glycosyltransferase involved in cell wall biosynthesis
MNKPFDEQSLPFFSICIDLYNREDTIKKVLTSICNQTFTNYELIIVDSGSTDKSLEICKEFLEKNSRINSKVYVEDKKENEIVGWNSPIRKARGEFIAICEGDDYFSPNHLQDAYNILSKNKNLGLYIAGSKLQNFSEIEIPSKEELLHKLLSFQWCPAPSCTIFLRQIEKEAITLYDEGYQWAAESPLYLRFLKSNYQIVINNSQNYVTRGFRFYLKNDYHIKDMIKFKSENKNLYNSLESENADLKIFNSAIHLLVFNMIFGIMNKNLFKLVKEYFKPKKRYFFEIVKNTPNTVLNAIKQRIKVIVQ